MKKLALVICSIILLTSNYAMAQQPAIGCVDKDARLQSEKIRMQFKDQGMEIYKDAMIEMENRQPYPIAVQLTQDQVYQFIFVGSNKSSKITMELYDGQDNMIAEKVLDKPAALNYFIYSFAPRKSDVYLIILKQRFKGKTICSSFTIMQNIKATTPPPASGSNK